MRKISDHAENGQVKRNPTCFYFIYFWHVITSQYYQIMKMIQIENPPNKSFQYFFHIPVTVLEKIIMQLYRQLMKNKVLFKSNKYKILRTKTIQIYHHGLT